MGPSRRTTSRPSWHRSADAAWRWHMRVDPVIWHHLYACWRGAAILCLIVAAIIFGSTIGNLIWTATHTP